MRNYLIFFPILIGSISHAQIHGFITDSKTQKPLQNVNVTIRGKKNGTSSDENGRFSIDEAPKNTLIFSLVGYTTRSIYINQSDVSISLDPSEASMQEVIITGYSRQSKRDFAGSASKIRGDEVKLQPLGSFDKALQGEAPGVMVLSQSGQPGSSAQVTIRGAGSINGTTDPLYIMDGIQINANDFQSINPGDIETISILKDAVSTSIYGSRGANGVIVITTRNGVVGKTHVNYDGQYGYSELPTNRLKLMNSAQKLDYEVNYDRPAGKNPLGWTPTQIDSLSKLNYNIKNILFRKGITQQHQVSVSGGNDKTRFYLSGSIFDQQGIVITTGLKRYTERFNIDHSFGNFHVGLNTSIGYSSSVNTFEANQSISSPLNAIQWFNPYISLYDANGNFQQDYIQGQPNPLQEILQNNRNSNQLKGLGTVFAEYSFPSVNGLKIKTSWGGDYTQNENFVYFDRRTVLGGGQTGGNGSVTRAFNKNFRYTGTTSVSYQHSSDKTDLNLAVYQEIVQNTFNTFQFTGFGLVGPFKNEAGITPGTPSNGYIPVVSGNGTQNDLLSYFFDGNFGYLKKYYVFGGFRRDGSSRLSPDQRWANFYQGGFSWIMTEERFLHKAEWLNLLKFKISYGSVGSQGIGDFSTRELLGPVTYNGQGGLILTNLSQPLTWEKKLMFNTGFEFAILKGRLTGSLEAYNNKTSDLFLNEQLSRTSGFQFITVNAGALQNRGIELSLNGTIVHTNYFNWSVNANYTHNKNKLLSQNGQDKNINGIYINKIGYPINSIYVVLYAGVDPQTGDALYYTSGSKTTKTYNPADRQIIGPIDPPDFGGFGTNLNYRGIKLNVMFSYAFGNYIYNNQRANVENPIYWYSEVDVQMLKEWRKPGDITDVPSSFSAFQLNTSRFVEKGNFIRLRNVTLAYTLPKILLDRWQLNSIRLFLQGENLYIWDHFLGYDPEALSGIQNGAQYPQLKTVTIGLNVGF